MPLVFELATARIVWDLLVFAVTMPSPLGLRARLVAVGYPGGQLLGERARIEHGVNPYGRPESRATMRCWLRETTSVIVAVQEPPRLSVMADRGSTRVLRERGDIGSVEHGAPAVVELAGSPASEGCLVGASRSAGNSRSRCRRDDVTSPGADVDVSFIAKSGEAVAQFGFDADPERLYVA